MKPIIFYVDDEKNNLTVFEASAPSDWEVHTFENPMEALEALEKISPWVIITDQRMPGITGVRYLELAKKIHPDAIRIIVTAYSDEQLVMESVKKAQVYDYIKKPWDTDVLELSIRRAIELYTKNSEAKDLHAQIMKHQEFLVKKNEELTALTTELEKSHKQELELRKELECWVPPFLLWALKENELRFPLRKDIVGLAFDIISSSSTHDFIVNGRPLRSVVIQMFSEAVLRNGGWRESHSGDSAYAHFGLWNELLNPYEGAIAAAREFRVALRSISKLHGVAIECGIALHVSKGTTVDVHMVQLLTAKGPVVQKSFDTTSIDIDLLHKMEKLVHRLSGTNIIMSEEFLKSLAHPPENCVTIGKHKFPGNFHPVNLHMIKSDRVSLEELEKFKAGLDASPAPLKLVA